MKNWVSAIFRFAIGSFEINLNDATGIKRAKQQSKGCLSAKAICMVCKQIQNNIYFVRNSETLTTHFRNLLVRDVI